MAHASRANPQKFMNDVMGGLYTREYMACHTLGGKSSKESDKNGLPPDHISTLIGDYDVLLTSNYNYNNYPSQKNKQTTRFVSGLFNECFNKLKCYV